MTSRRDRQLQQLGITQWALRRPAALQGEIAISLPAHVRLVMVANSQPALSEPFIGDILRALKLTPDEEVTLCLGVGEGIESALSLRHLPEFGASPVWSLVSANGVTRLPALPGVEALWLAVDHDPAGVDASRACAERWRDAGAEAFLVKPRAERSDLNDVFRGPANA